MQVKVLKAVTWLVQNIGTLVFLAGLALTAAAGFSISQTVGLFVLGGELVVLAVIIYLPDPRERG